MDCSGIARDALRDTSDGKIATAKNPRKWPNLFDYGAARTGAATGGREAAARANHDVPAHAEAGGGELARCGINSTAGLAGLFEPADKWFGLKERDTDFSQTLATHVMNGGTYMITPFGGPLDVRNVIDGLLDGAMNPLNYVIPASALKLT
jgi:MlaA lipoprotein